MRQLQAEIIETLHVQPNIDPAIEFRKSVDFLKGYLTRNKASKAYWDCLAGRIQHLQVLCVRLLSMN